MYILVATACNLSLIIAIMLFNKHLVIIPFKEKPSSIIFSGQLQATTLLHCLQTTCVLFTINTLCQYDYYSILQSNKTLPVSTLICDVSSFFFL